MANDVTCTSSSVLGGIGKCVNLQYYGDLWRIWKGAVILHRRSKYRQYHGRVKKKKKEKGRRGGRRNEISLVPSPGGQSAKTSVTIRLFVLLTVSLLLGRAVHSHSSITWSRQAHEALRGNLAAVIQAFSTLGTNRASDFILQCFWSCIFHEQEINTKMESSLPLTWQWLSKGQTRHPLKSKGKKKFPSTSKGFGSRPRRTSSHFWRLLGYWKNNVRTVLQCTYVALIISWISRALMLEAT